MGTMKPCGTTLNSVPLLPCPQINVESHGVPYIHDRPRKASLLVSILSVTCTGPYNLPLLLVSILSIPPTGPLVAAGSRVGAGVFLKASGYGFRSHP